MTVETIAADHAAEQRAIARLIAGSLDKMWRGVDPADLVRSWSRMLPAAWATFTAGQARAAASADPYVSEVLGAQDIDASTTDHVNYKTWAGVTADGRAVETLLMEPPIKAKSIILKGGSVGSALATAGMQLDLMVRTEIADAGRSAVSVATTSRRRVHGYVRMLNPPSCSRCVILAGRWYRWNAGFQRHPGCDCRSIPSNEDTGSDFVTDPKAYFTSLSRSEQEKVFGPGGAKAIREGADISRVVNADRGTYVAGGHRFTHEAAGKRPRLMPATIYAEANGNREEAIRLLRLHGYLA